MSDSAARCRRRTASSRAGQLVTLRASKTTTHGILPTPEQRELRLDFFVLVPALELVRGLLPLALVVAVVRDRLDPF